MDANKVASISYDAYSDHANVNGEGTYDFLIEITGTAGQIWIKDISVDPVSTVTDANGVTKFYDKGEQTPGVNIPEFPTLALPIAAILGLVFVFGRKKEGL
jgi:hypothetical protein